MPIFDKMYDIGNLLVCDCKIYAFAGGSEIKNLPQAVGLVGGFDCSDQSILLDCRNFDQIRTK
jgi:hypothetical protein